MKFHRFFIANMVDPATDKVSFDSLVVVIIWFNEEYSPRCQMYVLVNKENSDDV